MSDMMTDTENKKLEALQILREVGISVDGMTPRRRERLSLALLAVASVKPTDPWRNAACWTGDGSRALRSRDIITFWNEHYGEKVSSGSYDDVRRQELIVLVEAQIVLRSANKHSANQNDPTRGYAVSEEAVQVLRSFGTEEWQAAVATFRGRFGILKDRLERVRRQNKIPVRLPSGISITLDPGEHNEIQKAIVEDFLARFVDDPGAEVLYIGDASKKIIVKDEARLLELGFFDLDSGLLPDVVAFDPQRGFLLLIEAVHSSNPISKMRHLELERLTRECKVPRVYVSAFRNRESLRKWLLEISWETEVWLVESPDHLIHFDGTKFFGPYEPGASAVPG